MHTTSIQTQYYDEGDIPATTFYQHSTQGGSFRKEMSPSSSGVALRIQQNIREYQDQIKKNKNTINQLECQRKFFEKLSQKQKNKIEQIDLEQIRDLFETRIFHVKQQLGDLHQLIVTLQDEQHQTEQSYTQTYAKVTSNKEFLMQTLIQLQKDNESIANSVDTSSTQLSELEQQIALNQKNIKEKQANHRKYIQLQIQIERLQKNVNPSQKQT